ncbi:MAG: hypothetical protein Q8J64_10570 [Thermodesulfovibrionales bacterium]|nr:hypothetical protein [Thermodesulfovibrionales bacterium]
MPLSVGIGGSRSGAGKTTFACSLLRGLSLTGQWGAIKYTKTLLYSSIIDAPEMLRQEGKDTARFLEAGAGSVLWVQSPHPALSETLEAAAERLYLFEGIIIEGNGAIEVLRPDIVIFIFKAGEGLKPGAENVLRMADIVLRTGRIPVEGCVNYIKGRLSAGKDKKRAG